MGGSGLTEADGRRPGGVSARGRLGGPEGESEQKLVTAARRANAPDLSGGDPTEEGPPGDLQAECGLRRVVLVARTGHNRHPLLNPMAFVKIQDPVFELVPGLRTRVLQLRYPGPGVRQASVPQGERDGSVRVVSGIR